MIKDLMKPEAYPEPHGEIHLLQTHISFIILTEKYVYKIKKPVNFGFLDFTTLDKRRFYCQQELDLNRRLSPEVYLDLIDIRKKRGHFIYDEDGEVVDYAVKMKRLPDEAMMTSLLKEGKVNSKVVEKISRVIAEFHSNARMDSVITSYGSPEVIKRNVEENFSQTEKYIGETISGEDYGIIKEYSKNFMKENESLLLNRIGRGRIRDCHGDIHMEHVYLINDNVYIIDCIEFNERFRYSDVAADIAFLAMDLDFHAASELSEALVNEYIHYSGDPEIAKLIDFYKCYRAYVRGKVDSFELDDPNLEDDEKEKIRGAALNYFRLAASYACQ